MPGSWVRAAASIAPLGSNEIHASGAGVAGHPVRELHERNAQAGRRAGILEHGQDPDGRIH
jgi:hypothetical protein